MLFIFGLFNTKQPSLFQGVFNKRGEVFYYVVVLLYGNRLRNLETACFDEVHELLHVALSHDNLAFDAIYGLEFRAEVLQFVSRQA
jgi:hypothetical protein